MSHTFWTNKTYEQQEIQLALWVSSNYYLIKITIPIQIQHPNSVQLETRKNNIEW